MAKDGNAIVYSNYVAESNVNVLASRSDGNVSYMLYSIFHVSTQSGPSMFLPGQIGEVQSVFEFF